MMRSNALIPALLAFAVLCLLPARTLAKTTHRLARRTAAAASSPNHAARKKSVAAAVHEARSTRRHSAAAPELTHAHTQRPNRQHLRRAVKSSALEPAQQPEETAGAAARQKATSADFLRAASEPTPVPAPVAIHGTARPEEPSEAQHPASLRRHSSVARPVPVISVVRPSARKPQLESVQDEASTPVILPALYNKRGRLIMPPALKGSHEILIHQNQMADRDGLHRIQNDDDLLDMRNQKLLVGLPVSNALDVDDRLPVDRRYCRPWTAQFLANLARAHYEHFHSSLQVNSAVSTVEFQQHLMHINGNAAPAEGDTASPHLTGQAIDIAKHGLSLTEIAWMRGYLLPLVQEGRIDVEEEFQQSCFHISVYKNYAPFDATPKRYLASSHQNETSTLATAIR